MSFSVGHYSATLKILKKFSWKCVASTITHTLHLFNTKRLISHIAKDTSDVTWTVIICLCSQRETYPRQDCLHFLFAKDYGYEVMRASDWLVGGQVSPGARFVRFWECVRVFIQVWGRKRVLPPTWKLMLLSVGSRLFLVVAWWAGMHGDISAFFPFISFSLWKCESSDKGLKSFVSHKRSIQSEKLTKKGWFKTRYTRWYI